MKVLYDYFPILCFFIAYKFFGIYIATAVTMGASLLQIAAFWLINRRIEKLHLIMLVLILLMGSMTLIFHDEIFIKWKPSLVYWAIGSLLLFSHFFGEKPIIHRLLSDKIEMPHAVWRKINFSWGIFFLVLGWINIYIVYHFSTNAWVNFKLIGTLGLTILFAVAQILYLSRYIKDVPEKK